MLFRGASQRGLDKTDGVDLLFGDAAFTGEKTISVKMENGSKKELSAELIFLNTGCKTIIPDIDGLTDIDYLTSTTILELDKVPEHFLVIGGNYIGMEFGQMFRRFGSKVPSWKDRHELSAARMKIFPMNYKDTGAGGY